MSRKKPCIRCLLRDMDEEENYQRLRLYLDQFDESIRTSDEEYERRLQLCKECESLREGICVKCGCYVEARALRKQAHCPHEDARW
ncbi:MAG: hypothetical protein K2K56_06205 [Lachnospiraceae bacterium]|nr:hypothetical protein [Lachnospiraceae bacterium]